MGSVASFSSVSRSWPLTSHPSIASSFPASFQIDNSAATPVIVARTSKPGGRALSTRSVSSPSLSSASLSLAHLFSSPAPPPPSLRFNSTSPASPPATSAGTTASSPPAPKKPATRSCRCRSSTISRVFRSRERWTFGLRSCAKGTGKEER